MARSEDRDRKRRLKKMMVDLQDIDPYEILPRLTCLSQIRKEQIRARTRNEGPTVAAGELFEELPKRENWYNILVNALRGIGEDGLADELEGPEKQASPSASSQSVATGKTSHHAPLNQSQVRQQHPPPPASDPHPHATQERRLEAEASVTPGYPVEEAEGHKGEERKGSKSGPDANPGQQPPSGASLPMPVQERKQEPPAAEPQSRESGPVGARASSPSHGLQPPSSESGLGGTRASSPSRGQQGHEDSESDESNTSPKPKGQLTQMSGNASPSPDAGTVGVSVLQREAARGRIEEDRIEGRRSKEEWNFQNKLNPVKIPKAKDNTVQFNNLSPTKDSRKFSLKACNVVEEDESLMSKIDPLESIDRSDDRALSGITSSGIFISEEPNTSKGGSRLQQIGEGTCNAASIGGVQGMGGEGSGTEEMGAAGGIEANNDNQGTVVMKVRSYLSGIINSVGDHMLTP